MILLRVLHAELLKMKRTIALKMIVIAPAVVVLLILFMASQAPASTVNRHGIKNEWTDLATLILRFWAVLMLPLFVALETALLAGLDHEGNQWKSLLARPVPRWTLYVAKLIIVAVMTVVSCVAVVCGILLDGAILPHIQPEVVFGFPVPWGTIFRDNLEVAACSFLALAVQHWGSLRWRSFSIAFGIGIVGTVTGFFVVAAGRQLGGWPQYFPWALPLLTQANPPVDIRVALLISGGVGVLVGAAGCLDFCRREVS